jgi:hypothetical protein
MDRPALALAYALVSGVESVSKITGAKGELREGLKPSRWRFTL